MDEKTPVMMTREQLYAEIWEISMTGVSKKYDVPYAVVQKMCKNNDIPIPPSGYWTKVSFGKPVEVIPLPEGPNIQLELHDNTSDKKRNGKKVRRTGSVNSKSSKFKLLDEESISSEHIGNENVQANKIICQPVNGIQNVYHRETLYDEVWENPVSTVARQYGVSDVALHKICKTLDVPVPARGYWAKIRAGEKIAKPPLLPGKNVVETRGARTYEAVECTNTDGKVLDFLDEAEKAQVLQTANQIALFPSNSRLHKNIIAYKSVVEDWNKKDPKPKDAQKNYKNLSYKPPFLAGVISSDSLPRVFRLLDTLYRSVESLGGTINDDLSLQIRNEHVHFEVSENQNKIKHEITKKEAQELIIYQDAKKHNSWAREPKIREYDYVFTGKLRLTIPKDRYFRDTDSEKIEEKLGEILIALYEHSEVVRIAREAREEAARQQAEKARLESERKLRYRDEVDKTIALDNAALDYETACRIREYVHAVESAYFRREKDRKTKEWIDWALKKADWYDPIIAAEDEHFGKRDHEKNSEDMSLERIKRYWW